MFIAVEIKHCAYVTILFFHIVTTENWGSCPTGIQVQKYYTVLEEHGIKWLEAALHLCSSSMYRIAFQLFFYVVFLSCLHTHTHIFFYRYIYLLAWPVHTNTYFYIFFTDIGTCLYGCMNLYTYTHKHFFLQIYLPACMKVWIYMHTDTCTQTHAFLHFFFTDIWTCLYGGMNLYTHPTSI